MPHKIAEAATNISYGASAGAVAIGGLTVNEFAMLGGLAVAVATFAVNWIYRHKCYLLEKSRQERSDD